MKKIPAYLLCALLMLSSCGTNTHAEQGAANGAVFGSIFGSVLGGILGGPRGSDIGTLGGMVGGAVLGGSVGAAVDKAEQRDRYPRGGYERPRRDAGNGDTGRYDDTRVYDDGSGFDPSNGGDDRITFDASPSDGYPTDGGDVYTTVQPRTVSLEQLSRTVPEGSGVRFNRLIEIRNASFVDADGDGVMRRGEQCKVSFDIMNRFSESLIDINPIVAETTGNTHIHISPSVKIERIPPGRGMRYTAVVYGDSKLKDGEAVIKVCVVQGGSEIGSQVEEFHIATKKE